MAIEFVAPDFISGSDADAIQARMMNNLPADIDNMPAGFPYDFTMPTALEKSELIQFHLVRALQLMFPMWAWEDWLNMHGVQCNVVRKAPTPARGYVTFVGIKGTEIPTGFIVCTPSVDDLPSIEFSVDENTVISESGTVTAAVTAVNGGTTSNVIARTVTLMSKPINGISELYNEEDIVGGTDEEDDEVYRERILEAYASVGTSNVGNDADLRRWAMEVDGVGDCVVVPAWEGPGTVKLAIVDANGIPANDKLIQDVYNHLLSPDDRQKRLLPTGTARVTIAAATTVEINYVCTGLSYESDASIETITNSFKAALIKYYAQVKDGDNVIRYTQICALLVGVSGVTDFESMLINGSTANISLSAIEYPETKTVSFE